ncbi:SMI1/KNR4 family protein [Streptomyces sp. NPDC060194]|uniref:SMI1/KNR4 family protein n=1 Tax=Streptomyces sp. NPDC060194 TaxID=3347069 RepID=UPI00365CEB9D
MDHWMRGPLGWVVGQDEAEETGVVFFRGVSMDAVVRGLLAQRRVPMAYGKGDEWGVVMHPMAGWGEDDAVDHAALCAAGGEVVVFVTRSSGGEQQESSFAQYRDGRVEMAFEFAHLGEGPSTGRAAFLSAAAEGAPEGRDERIAGAICAHFGLPELGNEDWGRRDAKGVRGIAESWGRIEGWARDQGVSRELGPPATTEDIARVEAHIGRTMPYELAELLRGHDGTDLYVLPRHWTLLSTSAITSWWDTMTTVWGRGDHPYFLPTYVPFASDGGGSVLWVDSEGSAGRYVHGQSREGESVVNGHPMWDSLTSLMHHVAEALETGEPLDGCLRPDDTSDFGMWRHVDDPVPKPPPRLGKYGVVIED